MNSEMGITRRGFMGAAIAFVAVAGLGYWGYSAYMKRELRSAVAVLLKDASGRLREALAIETGPSPAARLQAAKMLDDFAAATDKTIGQFKRLELGRDRAFTDNADTYLVTVREIFNKQAASHRLALLHAESVQALRDHMSTDNRTGEWVQQALRAKVRAEKDFRDYRFAVATYGTLLGAFPITQIKIAPFVEPSALVEEGSLAKARERAIESSAQAAAVMEKVRQLKIQ